MCESDKTVKNQVFSLQAKLLKVEHVSAAVLFPTGGVFRSAPKLGPPASPRSLLNHNVQMNFAERDIEGWTVKCRLQPSMEVPD